MTRSCHVCTERRGRARPEAPGTPRGSPRAARTHVTCSLLARSLGMPCGCSKPRPECLSQPGPSPFCACPSQPGPSPFCACLCQPAALVILTEDWVFFVSTSLYICELAPPVLLKNENLQPSSRLLTYPHGIQGGTYCNQVRNVRTGRGAQLTTQGRALDAACRPAQPPGSRAAGRSLTHVWKHI